jgi:hypothetical protein
MYSRQVYTEVSEEINTSSFSIEDMLSKLAVCSLLAVSVTIDGVWIGEWIY